MSTWYKFKKLLPILTFTIPFAVLGQNEDLEQRIAAFVESHTANYEKKYLNVSKKDLGGIDQATNSFHTYFELTSREKRLDNLGNNTKYEYYFEWFGFDGADDRNWAMKAWLKDFVEHKTVRAGRPVRSYPYISPTLVLINETDIAILTYKCSQYTEDGFKAWKKSMMKFFGTDETVVIEIGCEGPLEWTQNAPDPKSRVW